MKYLLILLVLAMAPCTAVAQMVPMDLVVQELPPAPSRVRYKLPVVPANADGNRVLTEEQWQQVILIASEYKGLFEWRLAIEPTLIKYQSLERTYELRIEGLNHQIALLTNSREFLTLRLGQEQKNKLDVMRSQKVERIVMWCVIVAETIVIGVLAVNTVID